MPRQRRIGRLSVSHRGADLLSMFLMVLVSSFPVLYSFVPILNDELGKDGKAETIHWLEGELHARHVATDTASLIAALGSNKELIVRADAAQLLGLRKEAAAAAPLKAALRSDSEPLVKETAAWALANMGHEEGRSALKELISKSEDIRRQSVLAGELAELGDPSAYSYAVKAVTSPDSETRFLSVDNLFPFLKYEGKRGTESIDPLQRLRVLLHDTEPRVRAEALTVLNRAIPAFMARSELQPLVEQMSKEDQDPQVRATAARILE